jgi:hypothetical protein
LDLERFSAIGMVKVEGMVVVFEDELLDILDVLERCVFVTTSWVCRFQISYISLQVG